ncbi:MAG: multidrug effflux MFS transporter [Bacteroidales bacterium]|nr:multidrug effflux MFS transporter [Bacteroidales bacterium]
MQTNSTSQGAAPASSHPSGLPNNYYWFFIIYMAALSAFGSFINDMYVPSLPEMCRHFHASTSTVQLGLSFGMLGLGLGQMILGPVSDRVGRKPVLIGSIILFTIACVVSIFSPTIGFFLVCRFFQGVGGSGGYFLARTMPADIVGGRVLAKMMAIIGAINGIAPASAPVIGGFMADAAGWRGTFVLLVVIGIVLLCFSPKLKETLPVAKRETGSLWEAFRGYGLLFRNRKFMIHVILKGSALGLLFAYVSSAPFIMQDHYGWSQSAFGVIMGLNAVLMAIGSMVALKFKYLKNAARFGGYLLLIMIVGEAVSLWFVDSFWVYEAWIVPALFAMGIIFTAGNTLAMNEGRSDAGAASAVLGLSGYVFGMTASPLVGLGNLLHSTAITFVVLAVIVFIVSLISGRMAPDLVASSITTPDVKK